jgi:hypothetical protein
VSFFTAEHNRFLPHPFPIPSDYATYVPEMALNTGIVLSIMHGYSSKHRDSSVGIGTGQGLDGHGVGVRFPEGTRDSLFCAESRPALEPTQPSYPMGI